QLVGDTLAAAQRFLPPEHGVVVGWYRSDPTGQHMISPDDHRAHVRHFQRPWQFALVVNIRPAGTRGGFFRPTGDPGSHVVYLPFYELLDAAAFHDGWKRPRVSWSNYWSPDPAVWRAQAESPRPRGCGAPRCGRPRCGGPRCGGRPPSTARVRGSWPNIG